LASQERKAKEYLEEYGVEQEEKIRKVVERATEQIMPYVAKLYSKSELE
jgi:hypothetical protein